MPQAVPTWLDSYKPWQEYHVKTQGGQDMNRPWTADEDSKREKLRLDQMYLQSLQEYNAANGTNVQPDQTALGLDAQPNKFTPTDHSNDGFFGGAAKALGMSTNDFGKLAALAGGGYGLYASGLLGGGAAAAAAAPSYTAEAVLSGAAPGAASMGGLTAGAAAGGLGGALVSSLGGVGKAIAGGAGAVGTFLKDNPTLATAGLGLLGAAAAGQDTKTSATSQKDPWAPAQPYLLDNLKKNADLQAQYAATPFNDAQKTAYQNSFNASDNFRNNVAPGLLNMVNSFQPYQRQASGVGQGAQRPQPQTGLLSANMQAPQSGNIGQIDWSKFLPRAQ